MLGRIVGRFRLVRLLGEGGMSSVYLGERADDFSQTAAVKVLREGLYNAEMLLRFQAEQQILAALRHPSIVHLIDGGVTKDGIPCLAMDFVEGTPLDRFCDDHRLSVRERIELIIQVLEAVEYAHQRFVAHCDLKFSHILVTPHRKVHLLDFGLIKLLEPSRFGLEETATTAAQRPLTPDFASPEQLEGRSLTTATDLYSTGIVLYTLLTGTHPFESVRDQPLALLHATLSAEVESPSHRLKHLIQTNPTVAGQVAAARATTPAQLQRDLHGDLDSIILKALRKEPGKRYGSAGLFAADLRSYLEALPVDARRGSTRYRVWKFMRRNRAVASAVGLLIFALLGGAAGVFWQGIHAQRSRASAEARFHDARNLTLSLLTDFSGDVQRLEGSGHAQQLLLRWSREALDNLARQCGGNTALQADLADTYLQVGNLQAASAPTNPNWSAESIASFDKGLLLVDTILRREPGNHSALLTKARLLRGRSQVEEKVGRSEESARDARLAGELARALGAY